MQLGAQSTFGQGAVSSGRDARAPAGALRSRRGAPPRRARARVAAFLRRSSPAPKIEIRLEEIGCVQWHMLEAPAGIAKRANPSCALKQPFVYYASIHD